MTRYSSNFTRGIVLGLIVAAIMWGAIVAVALEVLR